MERMQKEAVVVSFKLLSGNLLGGTEEKGISLWMVGVQAEIRTR
jgi:hypothetical protein